MKLVSGQTIVSNGRSHKKLFVYNSNLNQTVIDAWSAFGRKMRNGNSYDFGNFDQCMDIHEDGPIGGQYCLVQFYSTDNRTIPRAPRLSIFNQGWRHIDRRFGGAICIPASCPPEIVRALMTGMFDGTNFKLASDYNQSDYCKSSNLRLKTWGSSIILLTVLTILLIASFLGTFYDVRMRRCEQKSRNKYLMAFSLHKNASNLFDVEQDQSGSAIKCLHGIRAVSIVSIIFLHSFYHRAMFPVLHPETITKLNESIFGNFVSGISVSVDSFFLMSGLLVTRTILKDLDSWVERMNSLSFKHEREFM